MKKSNLIILIIVSTILCFTQTISAKTFHVADGRELFLAFSEASNNGEDDIIYLAAGVYKGEFIFETSEANSLTLTSEPGLKAEEVVFDGEDMVRPLYIFSDAAADIGVANITVRNGRNIDYGGGIYIRTHTNVSFYRSNIVNNTGKHGAVCIITDDLGSVTISENKILDNNSVSNGGGILVNVTENLSIINNTISGNTVSSGSGGGIYANAKGEVFFNNNHVTENTSRYNGGGIYVYTTKNLSITENNITKNITSATNFDYYGGGLMAYAALNQLIMNNNISENSSYNGGGIYVSGSSMSVQNNTITRNVCWKYGAIYANSSGEVSVINNIVTENISKWYYSGIYIVNATKIEFTKNNISKNISQSTVIESSRGSGIFLHSNVINASFIDNIIQNNSSISNGTLKTYNRGYLIVSNNTITQNTSSAIESHNASSIDINSNIIKGSSGKGIYITTTSETSITCTIHNNVITGFNNSSNEGAGIFVENFELIDIAQNLITNNKAVKGAGLFLNPASTLFLNSNTIADNIAEEQGGGLYVKTSNMLYSLSVKNNIFWNNSAAIEGDDIYLHGFGGNPRVLQNNNVGEIVGTFENTSNNLSIDPLFYSPETGDYHLRPNSPCINTGNSYYMSDLDGNSVYGERDIGAYEYNPTIPHPADTNKNFIIEESEYTPYNNSWHQNLPWPTEPTEIEIEYNTRAGFLIENGGAYTNTGAMKPLCWKPIN